MLVDEKGKVLSRTRDLMPPFTSLIENAVDHLGELGNTQGLYAKVNETLYPERLKDPGGV